jgi:formylglycine-generating enzyme required for sulfatase activity
MKTNRMMCLILSVLSVTLAAGCAGGLQQKSIAAAGAPADIGQGDQTSGMEFVLVKGGCFSMGDTFGDGDSDEQPVHDVCVSDFQLGKYEVTQSQWERVMGNNPSGNRQCGPDCPVESVSWNAIQDYIRILNSAGGRQYRLPTEAEWEYAARSGGKSEKWSGTSQESGLGEYAWYEKNSGLMTHRVGLKKANGLGLFDMSGNVSEWCQDWYGAATYAGSSKDNPGGAVSGEKRVVRGGSWLYDSGAARAAKRSADSPAEWDSNYGFRLVVTPG